MVSEERISKQVSKYLSKNFQNYFIGQATLAGLLATALTLAFVSVPSTFKFIICLSYWIFRVISFRIPVLKEIVW